MAELEVVTGHLKWCGMQSHPPRDSQAPDSLTNSYTVAAQPQTGSSLGFVSPLKTTPVSD